MVKRLRRGVTLMEMMIVAGITSVLFAIAAPVLLQANRQFIMVRAKIELQQEARAIMYVITRALRQGQSNTIVINRADNYQPYYSRLTFQKEQSAGAVTSSTMTFQQEGTTLYQVIGTNKRTLTKNLQYLGFTFPRSDDMTIISVSLTLQKTIYERRTKALHMASEKVRVMN